jgi:3-dehydroquinate synthase
VISDDHVFGLYGEVVADSLKQSGFEVEHFSFPEGEASKNMNVAMDVYEFLSNKSFTRSDGIVALGGGVVGDLAGFVASTFMRGIAFVQIPTSLLAMVDSSIGGKTAVNMRSAKNLVGTFSQPDRVSMDPDVLRTLEPRRVSEGIAEIVKCGAIMDKELWNILAGLKNKEELLEYNEIVLEHALNVKKQVVEEDEFDNGARLLLNFGHTIGHAIENTYGYGVITHGEAVSLGMVQMSKNSEAHAFSKAGTTVALIDMLTKFELPTELSDWRGEEIFQALTHDKKARGKNIKTIQLTEIGHAEIVDVPLAEMNQYVDFGH